MKNILFGIFAHPDDEAFGPSATLMKAVDAGTELHLICLTDGQAGVNPDNVPNLGAVRRHEWISAGRALGATGLYPLGYQDGHICHSLYEEIGDKIETLIKGVCTAARDDVHLSFITFDQNGLTGHLDHIAASFLATKMFCCMKKDPPARTVVKEIAYYCLSSKMAPTKGEWSHYYMPMGRPAEFINRRVGVRPLLPRKYALLRHHHSQRADAQTLRSLGDEAQGVDNFHVVHA
ncbi:PIG-L family deacetylase [Candidatus Saccharibacteria bacterium]|nr:PIG-L family deacetylase [Candidatus Saccharibacteria bacterium]